MSTATVVGSGPNGLACAVALARAGVEVTVLEAAPTIGGGTRSAELTVPGLIHDICSAVHPMAAASPFFRSLGLEAHGLEWRWPEVALAHPLDDGSAPALVRSLDRTADGLGPDGDAWRRLFASPAANFDALNEDLLRPLLHLPRHPLLLARFAARRGAGDAGRAALANARGAGAVRRRRRPRLQPLDAAAERLGGPRPCRRLPQRRLAGGGGGVAVDRQRPRRGSAPARGQNRDGGAGALAG